MDPLRTGYLTRSQIGDFITSERGIKSFESAQADIVEVYGTLSAASFLTLGDEPTLGSERVLTPVAGELTGTDGGANAAYSMGLADTAVTPNTYGDPAGFVTLTVDAKGRLTDVGTFTLSGASGVDYDSSTGVISAHPAGTYVAPTGTLSRSSFATYAAPTVSGTYAASELQAVADALQVVSRTLAALITDLKANGNLA